MIDARWHTISSTAQLRELFGEPLPRVVTKEMPELDGQTKAFIATAPFLVMATTGADGSCDAGPKGGPPGFVRVLTDARLLIPEFPGNRRFDGVQNLITRPGIGLLFVVPGISETLRVTIQSSAALQSALGSAVLALDTMIYGLLLILFIIYMPKGILAKPRAA